MGSSTLPRYMGIPGISILLRKTCNPIDIIINEILFFYLKKSIIESPFLLEKVWKPLFHFRIVHIIANKYFQKTAKKHFLENAFLKIWFLENRETIDGRILVEPTYIRFRWTNIWFFGKPLFHWENPKNHFFNFLVFTKSEFAHIIKRIIG